MLRNVLMLCNLNRLLSFFLVVGIIFSVVSVLMAATPDPGHNFSTVGGGTTTGDILYGSAADTLAALPDVAAGAVLKSGGVGVAPAWKQFARYNQSVSTPAAGFAADTYLAGSNITVAGLQAGSRYHMVFEVSKTAAGLATPILTIRFGTNGSVADTARCTLTWTAQTAATDTGTFEVWVTFRTVGAGTAAVLQCVGQRRHGASITGLGTLVAETKNATSAGFDSTVANSIIGTSVNGGASAAWTITLVQAELENIN